MKLPGSSRTRLVLAGGLIAVLAISVAAFLLLRSDGESRPVTTNEPVDTSGLLPAAALPGSGWAEPVDSELSYITPGLVLFSIPAMPECAGLRAFEERLQEADSEFATGTIRRFTRSASADPAATVAHLRATFTDPAIPARLTDELRVTASGSAIQACVAAVVRRDELDADVFTRDLDSVPSGSFGRTTTVILRASPAAPSASQTIAWWPEGETFAVVSVTTAGPPPAAGEIAQILEQAAIATRRAKQ